MRAVQLPQKKSDYGGDVKAEIRELISIPAIDKIKAATFPRRKRPFDAIATVKRMIGDHPLREECYEEKKVALIWERA
jgi:hypothetical protein